MVDYEAGGRFSQGFIAKRLATTQPRALPTYLPTDICKTDPDLAAVVAAWPELPAAIRAGIVAMVKAASPER